MIDPALLRDNPDAVRTALASRGGDLSAELDELARLESQRRRLLPEVEGLKRQQNAAGDEVARAKRQGLDITKIQEESRSRNQQIKQMNPELASRLVFVTGDMLSPATQARIAQTGNPYIAKPFAIERLEALVRTLLAQRPIEQQ